LLQFTTGEYYGGGGFAGGNFAGGLTNASTLYAPASGNAQADLSYGVDLLVSGVISTANSGDSRGGIVKNGAGVMAMTAQNTYTGGTIVNGGTIVLIDTWNGSANGWPGIGVIRGNLTINPGATVMLNSSGNGSGGGALGWTAGAQVTNIVINGGLLEGFNGTADGRQHVWNIAGGVNMTGGTMRINGGVSSPTAPKLWEWGNTAVTTFAATNSSEISGRVNIRTDANPNITFNVADGTASTDLLLSAALTQNAAGGGIIKNGAGLMLVSGINTYTGGTAVNAGTLRAGSTSAFGVNSAVTLGNTAGVILDLAGFNSTFGSLAGGGSAGGEVRLGNGTLTLGTLNANTTYAGSVTGMGALVKTGSGMQTLSGTNNTYSGGTTLSAGTLAVTGGGSIGTGAVTVTAPSVFAVNGTNATFANNFALGNFNGLFEFQGPNNSRTVLDGTVSGGGSNTVWRFTGGASGQNTGILVLNGTNTLAGVMEIFRGPVVLGNSSAAGLTRIDLNSNRNRDGSLQFSSGFAIVNNIVTRNAGETIGVGAANQVNTINGVISGPGGLDKVGPGTLVLTGNNIYTGTTTISAGTLQLGDGGAGGNVSDNAVVNNGTLVINRSDELDFNRVISGTGRFVQLGTGSSTLSADNTFSGGTFVDGGTLVLGNMTTPGRSKVRGTVTVNPAGKLDYEGNHSFGWTAGESVNVLNIYGGTVGGANFANHFWGGGNFTLNMDGGELKLGGADNPTLNMVINVLNTSTNPAVISKVRGNSALTIDNLATFNVTNGAAPVDLIFSGNINIRGSGAGNLTKNGAGVMVLSGSNTYTGTTMINAGTLRAGSTNAFGLASAISLANAAGTTLDLAGFNNSVGSLAGGGASGGNITLGSGTLTIGTRNITTTYGGSITGSGGLIKTGSGRQFLTGTSSFGGDTQMRGGMLRLAATNGSALYNGTNGRVVISHDGSGALGFYSILEIGASNQLGANVDLQFDVSRAYAYLSLLGNDLEIGNLSISGTRPEWAVIQNFEGVNNVDGSSFANATFTVNQTTNTFFNGFIRDNVTGTGRLKFVKKGAGTLSIDGRNVTYTGGTDIMEGRLISEGASLGGASAANRILINTNAVLQYDLDAYTRQRGSTITGAGTLEKTGAAMLVFGGAGQVNVAMDAGAWIRVMEGTLKAHDSVQANWQNNKASLFVNTNGTFWQVEGDVTVG
ncbi:MAG: autotransporter-associated beta strand repeat-containing protein, partial [Chthoniobacterales bacterium]